MKNNQFPRNDLAREYQQIEKLRYYLIFAVSGLIIANLIYLINLGHRFVQELAGGWTTILYFLLPIIFFANIIFLGFMGELHKRRVRKAEHVIAYVIHTHCPTLNYEPDNLYLPYGFYQSGLFPEQRLTSRNIQYYLYGRINQVPLYCWEVKTKHFTGYLVEVDFPMRFKGELFLFTDELEKWFGYWGRKFQPTKTQFGKQVYLESNDFEKAFITYGNDQITARCILNPKLMDQLLNLSKFTGRHLSIAFRKNQLFIAIRTPRSLFNFPWYRQSSSPQNTQLAEEVIETLKNTVDALKLNPQAWLENL